MIRLKRTVSCAVPVLAIGAGLAFAGCGGPSGTSTYSSTTTTSHQALGLRYKTMVSNGNHRLQMLSKDLNAAQGNVVAIESGFREVSATYRGVAESVQALTFPSAMRADVDAMVKALNTLAKDAGQGAESVTPAEFNLVFSNLAAHQKTEVAANAKVNHDLGIDSINSMRNCARWRAACPAATHLPSMR